MDNVIIVVGAIVIVAFLALIGALFAIWGLNGVFTQMGLEYAIPYTAKSIFFMWVVLLSFGRGGSSSSKK